MCSPHVDSPAAPCGSTGLPVVRPKGCSPGDVTLREGFAGDRPGVLPEQFTVDGRRRPGEQRPALLQPLPVVERYTGRGNRPGGWTGPPRRARLTACPICRGFPATGPVRCSYSAVAAVSGRLLSRRRAAGVKVMVYGAACDIGQLLGEQPGRRRLPPQRTPRSARASARPSRKSRTSRQVMVSPVTPYDPGQPCCRVSDSGSGMGAASFRQTRSVAVTLAVPSFTDLGRHAQAGHSYPGMPSSGRRGRRFKSGHPDQIIACQRSDLRSCWLTQVRIVRFWERRCPILGADLEAGSARTPMSSSRG